MEVGEEVDEEEEEGAWSSDSEVESAMEWLDLSDGGEAVDGGAFAIPLISALPPWRSLLHYPL